MEKAEAVKAGATPVEQGATESAQRSSSSSSVPVSASQEGAEADPRCARCGGPHPFDTSVPSVVWNATIRARGLDEFLCLTCVVTAFACMGESFTAVLNGGPFQGGCPIEIRIRDEVARDAARIQEENNALRSRICQFESAGPSPERIAGWQPIETAPKDGTRVLLLAQTRAGDVYDVGCFTRFPLKTVGGDVLWDWGWAYQPTHWMPLPDPPARPRLGDLH